MAKTQPSLTRAQLDYAERRINLIAHDKLSKAIDKLGACPKVPRLSYDEKKQMVLSGKAKIKSIIRAYDNDEMTVQFEFPEPPDAKKIMAAAEKWKKARDAEQAKIDASKTKLLDTLHLCGDGGAALALIEKFANE